VNGSRFPFLKTGNGGTTGDWFRGTTGNHWEPVGRERDPPGASPVRGRLPPRGELVQRMQAYATPTTDSDEEVG
jgi:hypothetical protein